MIDSQLESRRTVSPAACTYRMCHNACGYGGQIFQSRGRPSWWAPSSLVASGISALQTRDAFLFVFLSEKFTTDYTVHSFWGSFLGVAAFFFFKAWFCVDVVKYWCWLMNPTQKGLARLSAELLFALSLKKKQTVFTRWEQLHLGKEKWPISFCLPNMPKITRIKVETCIFKSSAQWSDLCLFCTRSTRTGTARPLKSTSSSTSWFYQCGAAAPLGEREEEKSRRRMLNLLNSLTRTGFCRLVSVAAL